MKHLSPRLPAMIAVALLLGSCAPEQPRRVAFNEAAFAGYGGSGSGQVTGRTASVIGGGPEKLAIFIKVNLIPVNAYTAEIVQRVYLQHENLQEPDPRFQKYIRQVESDRDGNFVFRNLTPGNYYVSCDFTYSYPSYNTDSNGNQVETELYYDKWLYCQDSGRTRPDRESGVLAASTGMTRFASSPGCFNLGEANLCPGLSAVVQDDEGGRDEVIVASLERFRGRRESESAS